MNLERKNESIEQQYHLLQEEREAKQRARAKKNRFSSFITVLIFLVIWSITNMTSVSLGDSSNSFAMVQKHALTLMVGFVFLGIFSYIPYQNYNKAGVRLVFFLAPILILWVMLCLPSSLVPVVNGARAWLKIPGLPPIQPAEIFKVVYIMVLTSKLARMEEDPTKTSKDIYLVVIVLFSMFAFPIMLQNDLGTVIHYFLITVFLLLLHRTSLLSILALGSLAVASVLGAASYIYSKGPEHLHGYKAHRIYSYLHGLFTGEYDDVFGYQVSQALNGFGSGGFAGKGFGNGIQKYSYVPETSTDFITVTLGEEYGFLGMFCLLSLYLILYWIISHISKESKDAFARYLAAGIGAYLIIQVFINVGVATGLLPVFGLTLPLFSKGGSSILAVMTAFGIVLNINKQVQTFEKKKQK